MSVGYINGASSEIGGRLALCNFAASAQEWLAALANEVAALE